MHPARMEQVTFADDGHQELLETIKTPIVLPSGKAIGVLGVGRDISERRKLEHLDQVRHQLSELLYSGDQSLLMQTALDTAEKITDSQIGLFHFVEPDQDSISLQVWSTRTLKEMCSAKGEGLHYPISEAGVWVDCIHQQQTVIHNNYDALPDKKGLPEGHARLIRELTIPLKSADKIVADEYNRPRHLLH